MIDNGMLSLRDASSSPITAQSYAVASGAKDYSALINNDSIPF
ncbi:hypothetical protein [Bartonella doshiae]|nr:hypothetical protein [Bartonella doshiae]